MARSAHDEVPLLLEVSVDFVHEFFGNNPVFTFLDVPPVVGHDSEIFCEGSLLHSLDGSILKDLSELMQFFLAVQLCPVHQTSGPGKNGSNGVGGGRQALLPLSVMSCHSSVSGFCFNGTFFVQQH